MSRIAWWSEQDWRIGLVRSYEGKDDPLEVAIADRVKNPLRPRAEESNSLSWASIVKNAKEVIYHHDDGQPSLTYVTWSLDIGTAELRLHPNWLTKGLSAEDLKRELALAIGYSVPVVPDDESLLAELTAVERELLADGFTHTEEDGTPTRYVYTPLHGADLNSLDPFVLVETSVVMSPTEVRLALAAARRELDSRSSAGNLLAALRLGITELNCLLEGARTAERDLQACLTRHPYLFGPDYAEIKPQHRLGGDYVMDYALVKTSGLIDMIEIEKSTHAVFTKKGDPSAALVHAEQQVLDWFRWVEDFMPLARRDLPDLQRPGGYVVIGRNAEATDERKRLNQRNQMWAGSLTIMTYDDLLARAQGVLDQLEGLSIATDQ